jgi:hypothetical protein
MVVHQLYFVSPSSLHQCSDKAEEKVGGEEEQVSRRIGQDCCSVWGLLEGIASLMQTWKWKRRNYTKIRA